ncbi:MAG: nucleoside hydrolase [Polyangiaceae bacterium]|jgi:pyrimidine-specific ribonucleoside hydrolase|nr:nucleoside hydrolase [Polyangiaceae bacterium]
MGAAHREPLDVVWDMETQDPDDFLTLLLLLGHPWVRLKAVTITPGSAAQVGLVRRALSWFDVDIPVGAGNLDHPRSCVSSWHEKAYGAIEPSRQAEPAADVLLRCCDEATTLITGAPLKNLGAAMARGGFRVGRLVAQGGFAGEGVVPPHLQLEKFRGRVTCPTFNLNGDPKAALRALDFEGIGERRFVSKNVCHGVIYGRAMHRALEAVRGDDRSLGLIAQGMEVYLDGKGARPEGADEPGVGKKFHDPLAACCAIDPRVGTWAEVELFREKGEWGSRLCPGSNTWIIVDHDPARFWSVLVHGLDQRGEG